MNERHDSRYETTSRYRQRLNVRAAIAIVHDMRNQSVLTETNKLLKNTDFRIGKLQICLIP